MKDVRNYHKRKPATEEISKGESKTEPNQVIPLKTMLERLGRGQGTTMFKSNYDGEDDYNEELARLQKMDQVERVEYMQNLQKSIKQQEDAIFTVQKRIKERKTYEKNAIKWQKDEAARIAAEAELAKQNPPV